jgi:hypothetical protein
VERGDQIGALHCPFSPQFVLICFAVGGEGSSRDSSDSSGSLRQTTERGELPAINNGAFLRRSARLLRLLDAVSRDRRSQTPNRGRKGGESTIPEPFPTSVWLRLRLRLSVASLALFGSPWRFAALRLRLRLSAASLPLFGSPWRFAALATLILSQTEVSLRYQSPKDRRAIRQIDQDR